MSSDVRDVKDVTFLAWLNTDGKVVTEVISGHYNVG